MLQVTFEQFSAWWVLQSTETSGSGNGSEPELQTRFAYACFLRQYSFSSHSLSPPCSCTGGCTPPDSCIDLFARVNPELSFFHAMLRTNAGKIKGWLTRSRKKDSAPKAKPREALTC